MSAPHQKATNAATVRNLLADQVPDLADRPVLPVQTQGSSNWTFRVGARHAVRLPRAEGQVDDLVFEARWLGRLAPELPVPVPDVVHLGHPTEDFPFPWTVVTWLHGSTPAAVDGGRQAALARTLGSFVKRLHDIHVPGVEAGLPGG